MSQRTGDSEPHVEVGFDCSFELTYLKQEGVSVTPLVPMQVASGTVQKPVNGWAIVPPALHAICINHKGALLARASGASKLVVIPPRSITFLRGGTKLLLQAARGDHEARIMSWQSAIAPVLESWIAVRAGGRLAPARFVACKPIDPHFSSIIDRVKAAQTGPIDMLEPLLMSAIYELTAKLLTGTDEVQLAVVPLDLPDTIKDLIKAVRETPAASWPLKEAADRAGYSPFHFSRVFKAMVGYGFHEYVDRCRTEQAVEMLVNTDNPVDIVASTCGFGTTQGLRESIKEYLGLVPSELRSMPPLLAERS